MNPKMRLLPVLVVVMSIMRAFSGPTNNPSTTNAPITVHSKTNSAANISKSTQSNLPSDVVNADAKVVGLYIQIRALGLQSAALVEKQSHRIQAHLAADPSIAMQISQLQGRVRDIQQQIVVAERWDFQIRDYHHLPPMKKPIIR